MNRTLLILGSLTVVVAILAILLAQSFKIQLVTLKTMAVNSAIENAKIQSRINGYIVWELVSIEHMIDDTGVNVEDIGFKILALTELANSNNNLSALETIKQNIDDYNYQHLIIAIQVAAKEQSDKSNDEIVNKCLVDIFTKAKTRPHLIKLRDVMKGNLVQFRE